MLAKLIQYEQAHGDCNVPQSYTKDATLGNWLNTQRQFQKRNELSNQCKRRLNDIGFTFNNTRQQTDKGKLEALLAKLIKYKQVHGDCNVPQSYKKDATLYTWVNAQR